MIGDKTPEVLEKEEELEKIHVELTYRKKRLQSAQTGELKDITTQDRLDWQKLREDIRIYRIECSLLEVEPKPV